MRLATLKRGGPVAVLSELGERLHVAELGSVGFSSWLGDGTLGGDDVLLRLRAAIPDATTRDVPLDALAAPIARPGKIVAIGLNYRDHAEEAGMELPARPLVFSKYATSTTGPHDPIDLPEDLTTKVDFEVELGVVIGRTARRVARNEALAHVFGYVILNDLSARDLQFDDVQWVRSKSFDTFCPMGPWVTTAEEIPDPQDLSLRCSVNGNLLQDGSTKDMVFGVAELVHRLSHSFTLEPGDVIATGTPAGVGFSRTPPVYVRPGDVVVTEIEGLGQLRNVARDRRTQGAADAPERSAARRNP